MAAWTEDERLKALQREGVLDTPAEAAFDEIVQAAARACGAPIAAISLVDQHRQWFKAKVGLDAEETPRDLAFCAHTIQGEAVMVVPDATADDRFAANPLVTGEPDIRFYAGAPIRNEDGVPLGALCVIDTAARPTGLSGDQAFMLQVLADQVSSQFRLRRMVSQKEERVRRQSASLEATAGREANLLRVLESGSVGWWDWDVKADRVVGNVELAGAFGLDPLAAGGGAPIEAFFANIHPADRAAVVEAVAASVETGAPFEEEYRLLQADGAVRWVLARGRCLRDEGGRPDRFPGVVINIDDRKRTERMLRDADVGRELALAAARLGRWDHQPAEGKRFYDTRARQLVGLANDGDNSQEAVFQRIHPEDRERVAAAVAQALDPDRRGMFRESFRVRDKASGQERWLMAVGRTQFSDGVCTRFMGVIEDVTAEKRAEEYRGLLTNELRHRIKNTLALVLSLVDASLRDAPDLATARRTATERLIALSQAHDLLTDASWTDATVPAIVARVARTLSFPADRLDLDLAPVKLGPRPALQLAMALHELGTNAIKYGALASMNGRIRMQCALQDEDDQPRFAFTWTESGGPPVERPTRSGFGAKLIERATAAEFDGVSVLEYAPGGVRWRLTAPFADLSERGRVEVG